MPGPTPERDPLKRIAALERRIVQLEHRLAGKRDALLAPRPIVRLGVTWTQNASAYPGPPATVFPVVFVDGDFTPAPGGQAATVAHHAEEHQVAAYFWTGEGAHLPRATKVACLEQNRRWWIVSGRALGAAWMVRFAISAYDGFQASDHTVQAAVLDYWGGPDPGSPLTLHNTCGMFFGEDGACGVAVWDDVAELWRILQMACN